MRVSASLRSSTLGVLSNPDSSEAPASIPSKPTRRRPTASSPVSAIDGRDVAVVVNDFTVKGASTSATNGKKVGHMKRTAIERGMPLVIVGESTGARLPDAMGSRGMGKLLGNDNTQFRRTRETPLATAVVGPSFGSSTWLACLADFAVMQKGATMAVSSPRLIEMALGQKVDLEELGGWRLHAETTGLVDLVVDSEEEMFASIKRFLSYLPSHHREAPPDVAVPAGSGADMENIFNRCPKSARRCMT